MTNEDARINSIALKISGSKSKVPKFSKGNEGLNLLDKMQKMNKDMNVEFDTSEFGNIAQNRMHEDSHGSSATHSEHS